MTALLHFCFSYRNKSSTNASIVNKKIEFIVKSSSLVSTVFSLGAKMNKSNNLYKDVLTGLFFTTGVFGFMSGEFIISTMLFGAATIASNLDFSDSFRA
jgi:hypothetical protein